MHDLFRAEAVAARTMSCFGAPTVQPPLSFTVWSVVAGVLALAVVAVLCFGEYTRRVRVAGITVPTAGVVRLMAPQPGVVLERHVREGALVKQGDVLFVLSTERLTGDAGAVAGAQSQMLVQLRRRHAMLERDEERHTSVTREQLAAAARRVADLHGEAAQIEAELSTQRTRVTFAAAVAQRFGELKRQGFVSEVALQQKQEELLDQQARLQSLDRTRLAVLREAAAASAEHRQIPLRAELQANEIKRAAAALAQEIAATEANRRTLVVAPQDGVVTAILAEVGQMTSAQPLATLLPVGTAFEAHLFAPSRAAGFVDVGQAVRLRFAAFPWQKFGLHAGEVSQVSRSALAPGELPAVLGALAQQGEGLYRISVRLDRPYVQAYGRQQPLVAGMQVEADVLQDRRRLIEWVFEPLLSLRGKA